MQYPTYRYLYRTFQETAPISRNLAQTAYLYSSKTANSEYSYLYSSKTAKHLYFTAFSSNSS
jgi:hypothetical protein